MLAAIPANELLRLQALYELHILDSSPETAFDALTELAVQLCGGGKAAITLIDKDRQWFKSLHDPMVPAGTERPTQTVRETSFCSHAILHPTTITYVPDARQDSRFADNPLVVGEPGLRFYCGVPLRLANDIAVGTLCVFDTQVKTLSPAQQKALSQLAQQAVLLMQSRLLQQQALQNNQLLQQEKSRLDAVIEGTNIGTWEWNIQTGATVYNSRWFAMLGRAPEDHSNVSVWRQWLHPDDVALAEQALQQHFQAPSSFFDCRFRMLHQAGHWVWIHAVGQVMTRTEQGAPLLMFGTHRDVSEEIARQQEIQQTRSRLQAVIDSSTEAAMITTDLHGVIQLFNTGAERMLEYKASDVVNRESPALFHDMAEIDSRAQQLSAETGQTVAGFDVFVYRARLGKSETRQWTYITRSGARKQVRLSVSAIRTDTGELQGYLGVAIDVTQLEQLNHALLLSEQRHRSMLENLPGVVYRCINDQHWTMLFISDEVEKLTGFAARSFIRNQQTSFAELQHPDDAELVREVVEMDLARHARFNVEYRLRHADGSWRWVQELGRGIYDNNGELLYIDGFIWDITAHKRAEQALRSGEQKLASLYKLAPLAISLSQFEGGHILNVNPHWQLMTGLSNEFSWLPITQLLQFNPAQFAQRQQLLLGQGLYGPVELTLLQSNGHQIAVRLSEVLIQDADGQTLVWSIMQDISEQRRIEQMKNQFVSMVSHELRTPLTAISGALGLMDGGALGEFPLAARPMLGIAAENCKRLTQLINDLLDIDKLVAGKMQFDLQPAPVRALLLQCVEQNQPYASKFYNHIELLDGPDAILLLDTGRFHQIMANLLSNAAKFSPAHSVIKVWTERSDERLRINVKDEGPGIPLSFRARMFEKFSQADSADARQRGGTGLGLAIVRELTEKMSGTISYHSEAGQGSCFYLDFPMLDASATAPT